MHRRHRFAFLLLLGLLGTGCTTQLQPHSTTAHSPQITTLLFFGLGTNDGGALPAGQFDAFVSADVIPRFPDGFTLLDARGQWREAGIGYAEPSRVLLIVHDDTPATSEAIEAIRNAYKQQFKQTSVLRLDLPVRKAAF